MSKTPGKDASDDGAPEVDTLEHEAFLTRWSKRKALSRDGVTLPEPSDENGDDGSPPDDTGSGNQDPRQSAGEEGHEQREEASAKVPDLPPIESLGEDSDYGAFMAAGVPADVQRKALRKLFQSPKFNVRDGLDDYDLDFSSPEPLGDIVTAEMRHRLRVEFERLARLDDEESGVEGDKRETAPTEVAELREQEQSTDNEPDDDEPATA